MTETIEIETLDGEGRFSAYVAEPKDAAKAAIIVVQEIFGVNAGIRGKADLWAAKGYLALAPDMFWRFAPHFVADPDVEDEAAKAFEIRTRFNIDAGIRDIEATIRYARKRVGNCKVGAVGYCMGGRVAYFTATRTDVDASVGYYGAGIDAGLHEAHAIARPLMLHFAERDQFIPEETRARVHAALDGNRHVTIHDYPDVDHGFATTSGRRRNDAAAILADARTEAFFAEHLA